MPWPSMKAIMSSFMLFRSSGMGDILGNGNGCNLLLYAVPPFTATGSVGRGRHKAHEHAVKLLRIKIKLNFDALRSRMLFIVGGPGQRVAIARAPVEIYGHIAGLSARDDAGIDPGGSGQFVPHNVGSRG